MNKIIERQSKIVIISEAKTNGAITPRMVSEVLAGLNSDKLEKDLSNFPEGILLKSDVLEVKGFNVKVNLNGYETMEDTREDGKSIMKYINIPDFSVKLKVPYGIEQMLNVDKVEFFTTDNTETPYHIVTGTNVNVTGHHMIRAGEGMNAFLNFSISEEAMSFENIIEWGKDTKTIVRVTLKDIEDKVYIDCLLSDEFMGVGKLIKEVLSE